MTVTLEELLARATALEAKAAEAGIEVKDAPAAELLERIEALEDAMGVGDVDSLDGPDDGDGFDFGDAESVADALDAEVDDEAKASWGACPNCGSTETDEYADGDAACTDCGTALAESKGYDFEDVADLDDAALGVEVKSGLEVDDEVSIEDLMRARRVKLGA